MSIDSNTHSISPVSSNRVGEDIKTLTDRVAQLESQVESLRELVAALGSGLQKAAGRYVANCPECATDFDMLAHHYSIGLFDNLVYVKCPECQKALPLRGGPGGNIRTVED